MRLQKRVQLIEHNARARAHGLFFEVQSGDVAVEAGEFEDQPVANRAAHQSAARSARSQRDFRFRRRRDDGGRLARAARERHRRRLDLVMRGVGGV